MDFLFIGVVIFLFMLAVFDLWVGVSNDAVNFLTSALGSKAAPLKRVLLVASVGVFVGAAMSNGMMDIARHGIFRPENFSFYEIICIFMAVMVTDIILLDVFNTLGMPTSTTVSMVFELLGATFVVALIKMAAGAGVGFSELLNTEKALSVILGIFLSVAIAFFFGTLVQFLARTVFTFNYRSRLKWKIGIFGGVCTTAIVYFLLLKGVSNMAFMTPAVKAWINSHTAVIILGSLGVFTVVMQALHALKVNVLKVIVLMGTFALAMAFAGNDHRLGAQEAPPAIISIFLGDELTAILHAIETGTVYGGTLRVNMEIGVNVLPSFTKDTTDRNRTSPFAFTGNKFEFRSLGSQLNIACPNIMLNTIIADELEQFADELEGKSDDFMSALNALIKRVIKEHKRIIFNGDGYADAWKVEAARRGLTNLPTTVDALPHYTDEKNVKLFAKHKIYTEVEMQSRQDIILETYAKTINIEALTASDMVKRDILPAVSSYVAELASGVATKKAISDDIPCEAELDIIKRLSGLQDCAYKKLAALDNAIIGVKEVGEDPIEVATYYKDSVITAMTELRAVVDEMETLVSSDYWPYPSYGDLMFRV